MCDYYYKFSITNFIEKLIVVAWLLTMRLILFKILQVAILVISYMKAIAPLMDLALKLKIVWLNC